MYCFDYALANVASAAITELQHNQATLNRYMHACIGEEEG